MAARGLTRKITKKQALSYEVTTPNPIGVTAIASVNRRRKSKHGLGSVKGLKAARLAQMRGKRANDLRRIVRGERPAPAYSKTTRQAAKKELQRRGLAVATANYADRYERTRALLHRNGDAMPMMMNRRRRARRNMTARELNELHDAQMAAARGGGSAKPKRKKRLTRAQKAKRAKLSASRQRAAKRRIGRSYGRFKSIAGRTPTGRRTASYLYRGKGGKPKKIPLWAILGAKSKKSFEQRVADDSRLAKRVVAAKKRRDRAAKRLLLHGDAFTPNRRRKTMHARRNRHKKGKKLKGKAKAAFLARMARGRRSAARRTGGSKRKSSGRRKTRRTRTPAQRRATAKMLAARWKRRIHARRAWKNKATPNRRRRRSRRNPEITQAAANRRRRRRKARRNPVITQAAANRRRRRRKARRNPEITQAAANRRRRRRKARRNPVITQAAANRRRRRRRRSAKRNVMYSANRRRRRARHNVMYSANRRRRRARRNGDVMGQLKDVLKIGAGVLVGFVAHRGLTWVVSEKLLTKVDAFNTGTLSEYRGLISGGLVVGAGVALLAKFAPGLIKSAGVGASVSFLQGALLFALKKMGQPEVAGYFAAYPDAEGKVFHTMGSYEVLPPGYAGLGEYDYYNQYSGMGAPELTQAAAGMGEYFAPSPTAIGEYEAVDGFSGVGAIVDEGIHPNLTSAERALSVAEAAAGIGDLPLQSILDPYQIAAPIMDGPGGSRAGILQGPEGIFGS